MSRCKTPGELDIGLKLKKLLDQDGVKVFAAREEGLIDVEHAAEDIQRYTPIGDISVWAQDIAIFTPTNSIITHEPNLFCSNVARHFKARPQSISKCPPGGNLFVTNNNGKNSLLIGKDSMSLFNFFHLKKSFGVEKINSIPQGDFHNDLFIRPLKDNHVLVCDDDLTMNHIKRGIANLTELMENPNHDTPDADILAKVLKKLSSLKKHFENFLKENPHASADEMVSALESKGYTTTRVPGRLHSFDVGGFYQTPTILRNHNNMNALVYTKENGDTVYIAGKNQIDKETGLTPSIADKIGFGFQKIFEDSISQLIKKENLHFIDTESGMLANDLMLAQGGLHCKVMEIPKLG